MTKQFIAFFSLFIIIFTSCEKVEIELEYKDEYHPFTEKLSTDTLQYKKINTKNKRLILQLDEPTNIVTNASLRSFRTDELIQIRSLDRNMLRVTSYSAAPISNLQIHCRINDIDNLDAKFMLLTIDSLPGFGQFDYQPAFTTEKASYKTDNGKYISFHQPYFTITDFEFTIESDDEHFQKLKTIKSKWNLSFSNYHWNGVNESGSWREMSAIYAREWVAIMTNYAYIVATPEFKQIMFNYKKVLSEDLYGNGGKSDIFTQAQYEALYYRLFNNSTYLLGRTGMGGGLGGGTTLGADHWIFYSHYISREGWHTVIHEMSHCMGYSHDSNMTYGNQTSGFADAFIPKIHSYLRRKNTLPYNDPNLLGFTKPENKEYLNLGIEPSFTEPDFKTNEIDDYFKSNPILK